MEQKIKILFVNPSLREGHSILPVGLASVMTVVQQAGYEFELLDIDIHEYSDEHVDKYFADNKFDVVMSGSIITHYKWMKWLASTIKKHQPEATVVFGNSIGGSCPEVLFASCPVDIGIKGEGEYTAVEVIKSLNEGAELASVEGIIYRDSNGNVRKNLPRKACNINELPHINWGLFDIDLYMSKTAGVSLGRAGKDKEVSRPFSIATARGCAFKCTFCHYVFWDDPYRFRKPELVMEEIKSHIDTYGANLFNFWDDLSFASLPQVEKMVDEILKSGLKFEWSAAIRTDLFGKEKVPYERKLEIAHKMRKSGCTAVGFSLESANKEILEMMNKKIEPEYFSEQIKILKEAKITSNTSVVFGYPMETEETIKETFDMCYKNKVYPSMGFLLPLPYTGMYEYAKEHGFIKDEDAYLDLITERQDICVNMTQMTEERIMECIKEGASKLNELLSLGLTEDRYIRTGATENNVNPEEQFKDDKKRGVDPDNMERNVNDFSFNYSEAVFDMDYGSKEE
ncbi:MAG: B12-binding domain-containing radical SAM protein [Bacteriovoracaceae bacterium]|jgi:anaerobic magnesium-protoporphyrin IX monomethyl ester cyclase|nr:B12-binding domain-containing radical SAM protein [Bacteriovoracaceae bacterium]